ncbi:MAG TPA: hypothetical protein VI248_13360 [Kineosporiaceae bacterium]
MTLHLVDLARHAARVLLEPFAQPVRVMRGVVSAAPGLALVLLGVLVVTMVMAARGNRLAALAAIPLALAWLVFNTPFEGPTLVVLSWSHGITATDLISVAALAISGWRLTGAVVAGLR